MAHGLSCDLEHEQLVGLRGLRRDRHDAELEGVEAGVLVDEAAAVGVEPVDRVGARVVEDLVPAALWDTGDRVSPLDDVLPVGL